MSATTNGMQKPARRARVLFVSFHLATQPKEPCRSGTAPAPRERLGTPGRARPSDHGVGVPYPYALRTLHIP